MSYRKGYSIMHKHKNWNFLQQLDNLRHSTFLVKRHMAKILIRLQLELFAADLYMTDHYKLNLPYVVCRKVAEMMSDENLFQLVDQIDENNLEILFPMQRNKRQRCPVSECTSNEDVSHSREHKDDKNIQDLFPVPQNKRQRV
ncbi:hypothetical protein TKK_0012514 [Trichogramma kaykai]